VESKLSFNDRPCLIVSKERKSDNYRAHEGVLISHEYGFSHISLNCQTSSIQAFTQKFNAKKNRTNFMPIIEYIAENWKKENPIIPIFPSALALIKRARATSIKGTNKKSNSSLAKLRRLKLASNTNALSGYIKKQAVANINLQGKEKEKKK